MSTLTGHLGKPAGARTSARKADPHRRAADVVRRTVRGFGEEVTEGESPTQKNIRQHIGCRIFGEPAGARTQDPNIKSVVLYLLSYGFSVPKGSESRFGGANVRIYF